MEQPENTNPQSRPFKTGVIWKESLALWLPGLKITWGWLFFSISIEELFSYFVQTLSRADERLYIVGIILAVLFQLLISAIGVIVVNQYIFNIRTGRKQSLIAGLRENLKYVFIESTRAILPVLLKCLLFIIPGVVEGIRLYFVPFVAQFDSEYKAGRVDALDRSRALVRGRFWSVTVILILSFLLSIVPRFLLESVNLSQQPVLYALMFFVSMAAELYGDIAILMTYVRLEDKSGYPISLS